MAELSTLSLFSDANLVSYYKMEGNSNDAKGSNNGTDTAMSYGTATGKYNQGASLNGSTSKILVTDATSLKQTGTITIAGWIYPTAISGTQIIFQKGREAANQLRYGLQLTGTGRVLFRVVAGSGRSEATTATLSTNTWQHIAVTCNINGGTNATFYIGGSSSVATVTDASSATYTNVAETNQLGIGVASDSTGFLSASLDDFSLFSRGLSGAEIATLAATPPYFGSPAIFF